MTSVQLSSRIVTAVLLMALGLAGCATPVAPTGGPPDTTPPFLVSTVPPANSVSFSSDRIKLVFSEKVDRASFQRALTFTPGIALPPDIDWDGKEVELRFSQALRDSTTYIVQIDNQFRDYHGVSLDQPISFAFATGPTIDQGTINGRVATPELDEPVEGIDVLAFEVGRVPPPGSRFAAGAAAVASASAEGSVAAYRTQTDRNGAFIFSNLPDRWFFVVAVEDRNRNRIVDSLETVALPSWGIQRPDSSVADQPAVPTPSVGSAPSGLPTEGRPAPTWYLDRTDTVPPEVTVLQPVNSKLVEIRFSEPIVLDTLAPGQWAFDDTLSGESYPARAIYQPFGEPSRLMVVTDSLPIGTFAISRAGVVRDTTGTEAPRENLVGSRSFGASMRPDTMKTRFVGFQPSRVEAGEAIEIARGRSPAIALDRFMDRQTLLDRLSAQDAADGNRAVIVETSTGTSWALSFDPPALPGDSIAVSFAGLPLADTVYSTVFAFLVGDQTGSITGFVGDTLGVTVELYSTKAQSDVIKDTTDEDGHFRFDRLIKDAYRLKVMQDSDSDGRWTPGRLDPPRVPEELFWYPQEIDVRKGWESSVDTLAFPMP